MKALLAKRLALQGMESVTRVQIFQEAVCFLLHINVKASFIPSYG